VVLVVVIGLLTPAIRGVWGDAPDLNTADSAALASSHTVYAVADASADSDHPDTPYGGQILLAVRNEASHLGIAFIRFDLPDLTGQVVQSASLSLYLATSNGANSACLPLYCVTQSWSESTVTWNNQPNYRSNPYIATCVGINAGWVALNVTDLVQLWYSGAQTNYGLEIRFASGDDYQRNFYSKEALGGDNSPRLQIVYSPPTRTPTRTLTSTPSRTPTRTSTPTRTQTATTTVTPSRTATATPSASATRTATPTVTTSPRTPTVTPSPTHSVTRTPKTPTRQITPRVWVMLPLVRRH
jgi:hypothetical protein